MLIHETENIAKVFGPDTIYIYSIETVLFWDNCFLLSVTPENSFCNNSKLV